MKKNKLTKRGKEIFGLYLKVIFLYVLTGGNCMHVFAAEDPLQVINNLSDFFFSVVRAIGMIVLGMGVMNVGLSFGSHDPSQRSNGVLYIVGGIIITFSKEILNAIIG